MDDITKITNRLKLLQNQRKLLIADIIRRHDDDAEVIADLACQLESCEKSLRYTQKKIAHVLKQIRDPKLHSILEAKIYLDMSWEKVAEHIDCDVRTIYRLKKRAEEDFNRIINQLNMTF